MWKLRSLLALCVLSISACSVLPQLPDQSASSVAGLQTLRVCTSLAATQMNVQYALANQLDEKYGIDLEVTEMSNGSTMASALMSGDFDICQLTGPATLSAIAAGGDLVIVGGVLNRQPYFLVTRADIKTPSDLKGKAIAISGPGSASDFATRVALEHLGLKPDQDVPLLSVGRASDRIAAMASGDIAGTILAPPEAMIMISEGGNMLLDFSEMEETYLHTIIVTTRTWMRDHPELVKAYIMATSEAIAEMGADKTRTVAVMADYLDLDPTENAEMLELTYDLLIKRHMDKEQVPLLSAIQSVTTELAKENPDVAKLQPEDVLDLSIIEQLRSEGFYEALK